jgi:hypothetical protein
MISRYGISDEIGRPVGVQNGDSARVLRNFSITPCDVGL